jgi:general secretion pathway protein B
VSYILDALRKAERERSVSRVPTLSSAHSEAESLPRSPRIWAIGAGLGLSAIVAGAILWASGRPPPAREAATPPVAASSPATLGTSVDSAPPPPAPPRAPQPAEPAPVRAAGPAVERPPGGGVAARPSLAPVAPAAAPPAAARASTDLRRAPEEARSPMPPAARQAAVAEAPPPPLRAARNDAVAESRTGGDLAAQPPLATAPPSDGGAIRPAQPATGETLPRLTLDVLVYSDVPAERLIFINGRKYVEGQAVDGGGVVEQIMPDGVILRREGKQIVLRPKLNPYASP